MNPSLDVGLLETTRTTGNGGSKRSRKEDKEDKDPLEEFIKKLRGPAGTVASYCSDCGRPLSDGLVSLAESRELFAAHLKKVHPEKKPRDIRSIREECDRNRQKEEARKAKERKAAERKTRVAAREVGPAASKSGKTVPGSKRNRKKIRQPSLTDEMVAEMKQLYVELGKIRSVCSACYKRFGFSSPEALRVALFEHKIVLGIPQNQRRVSGEIIEEIQRLHQEERLSVRAITERCYLSCGYSFNGFRNLVRDVLIKNGLDPKENTKRVGENKGKMTPAQIDVTWRLYSVGNYSIPEIQRLNHESWGVSKNCVVNSLKRAGHKLRVNRWDNDGTRPISEEEAIRMIKAVA